jgi:hypothetical protein
MSEKLENGQVVGLVRLSRRFPKALVYVGTHPDSGQSLFRFSSGGGRKEEPFDIHKKGINLSFPQLKYYIFPKKSRVWVE